MTIHQKAEAKEALDSVWNLFSRIPNCLTCSMETGLDHHTDLRRWRLLTDCGDHHWRYLSEVESKRSPQSDAERHLLGLALPVGIQIIG